MHPEDVAEFVAESVEYLASRLAAEPTLGGPPSLEGTGMYIPFVKKDQTLVQQTVPTGFVVPGGGQLQRTYNVPLLGRATERPLLLFMDLDDFDSQPPTAELLLPDRTALPLDEWPKSISGRGIVPDHPGFPRPFFCRRGLREYHTHPQHEDDPWDQHREGLTLAAIAVELLQDLRDTWIGRR
jgi:hypothetical protein